MIFWSHSDLIPILKRHLKPIYIDGTFRCVSKPFKQLTILMAYDDQSDKYVPIVFCLMENKSQWSYWHFLHFTTVATNLKISPSTITTDYELSLIKACKEQFPTSAIIGCLFHFKQAIRRKPKKLHIDEDIISILMKREMMDSLTEIKKIIPQRILKLKEVIKERDL